MFQLFVIYKQGTLFSPHNPRRTPLTMKSFVHTWSLFVALETWSRGSPTKPALVLFWRFRNGQSAANSEFTPRPRKKTRVHEKIFSGRDPRRGTYSYQRIKRISSYGSADLHVSVRALPSVLKHVKSHEIHLGKEPTSGFPWILN